MRKVIGENLGIEIVGWLRGNARAIRGGRGS